MNDKQWFIDRIGKTIYRTKTTCECYICKQTYEFGTQIKNLQHANYIYDIICDSLIDGVTIVCFDTILERDNYENIHIR